jgi:ligand-binding SRPBCC domain-containing protein
LPRIELHTDIRAPLERCFDLARDLDLHLRSMAASGEQAVAGRTSGLIGMHEEVTWRARHFGVVHHHRSRITAFDRPHHFRDSMVTGRFRRFEHDHFFAYRDGVTKMHDVVEFESPFGPLGSLVDKLLLTRYLTRLINERNAVIKEEAEKTAT